MHDCRKFEDRLVDLVFNAPNGDDKDRRLTELESCDRCLNEYRSVTESLVAFDQAVEASLPDESYWPRHHELLRHSIARHALATNAGRVPLWRRGLSARISLPVPAAAVIAIALLALSVLAVRQSAAKSPTGVPAAVAAITPPARVIELPVVREKVVIRTVYVARATKSPKRERRSTPTVTHDDMAIAKESRQGGLFTRANLTDFQPPDEMRIRILKRSNTDEN